MGKGLCPAPSVQTGAGRQPKSHVQVVNGCNNRKWYDDLEPVVHHASRGKGPSNKNITR